jgi:hypothetical protein
LRRAPSAPLSRSATGDAPEDKPEEGTNSFQRNFNGNGGAKEPSQFGAQSRLSRIASEHRSGLGRSTLCRKGSPGIAASLAFCASHCQSRSLNLQAWQTPPMWVRDLDAALREPFGGKRGDREAAELLQRMLDAGLSKYEPDPLAALDQAMRSAP